MKIPSGNHAIISAAFVSLLLVGCNSSEPVPSTAIANPASEHCIRKGGKIEIVKDASGEKGMCRLPDSSVVDEWELFRRDSQGK